MKRVSNRNAEQSIVRREEFHTYTGNFWGKLHTPGTYVYTGRLPGRMASTGTVGQADYIVFSYSTPIAWHIPDEGWIVPPVSYSPTTSNHQHTCRMAARGDLSPRNLTPEWMLGLTPKAQRILRELRRYGGQITRLPRERIAPFQAVVDTGEAEWDPTYADTIRPTTKEV